MSIITTVPQGQHYDSHGGGSTHSPAAMECDVTFQSSCRYDLGNSNQYNWNKLMGFFDSPAGEVRSARWGWRWSLEKDCIEIAPFIHHAGTFVLPPVSQWIPIPLNTPIRVKVKLDRSNDQYIFTCINGGDVTTFTVSVTGPLANTYSGACRWDLLYFGGLPMMLRLNLTTWCSPTANASTVPPNPGECPTWMAMAIVIRHTEPLIPNRSSVPARGV
jgi:hypothetical protein